MKLYTVIFALFGRSTITQGRAESPQRALGVWSDDIMMRKGRATSLRMVLQLANDSKSKREP